jgi:tRNA (cmo5U34)-methyltransferase
MDIVKKHFEEEAKEFNQIILRLVPYYSEMIDALITDGFLNIEKKTDLQNL